MKNVKRLIVFVLIAALSLSLSMVAIADEGLSNEQFAGEVTTDAIVLQEEAGSVAEASETPKEGEVLPVDEEIVLANGTIDIEDSFDEFEPVDISEAFAIPMATAVRKSLGRNNAITLDGDKPQRGQESGTMVAESPKSKSGIETFSAAAYGYELYGYNGTINTANGSAYLYPVWLSSGENLQVKLFNPAGVNYDLYLYAYDMSTGQVNWNPIDYSIHANSTNTLPQAVAIKNATNADAAYFIEVYARNGYSATNQFSLYVAYSDEHDTYAPAQNAFTANQNELSGVALGVRKTTNTRSLNTPIDEDWFAVNVTNASEMNALKVTKPSSVVVELYAASTNASGNTVLTRLAESGTLIQAVTGTTYLRVLPAGSEPVKTYSISVEPVGIASSMTWRILDNGSLWSTQRYSIPGDNRNALQGGTLVSLELTFKTASGAPASNASASGSWQIFDLAWDEGAPSFHTYASNSGTAGVNGVFRIDGYGPSPLGQASSGYPVILYWDYHVHMYATYGTQTLLNDYPIYITSRIMS